jgi:dihydroorotate dehydrogenase (NAD+) catalytic subunit
VILNASGCLDALTAPEVARQLDAFVTKTVTPLSREGNAPVRIAETDTGMLNSIGLANPGIAAFLADVLPRLLELGPPVWVSVGGFAPDEYARLCARLDETAAAAIELNLSCPNVAAPEGEAAEIVAAARAATGKPLYAKLSPALPDVAAVALRAAEAGADGLSLVNTIRGLALDPAALSPRLSTATGGLSGPALRPIALAAVHACYRETGLPIVGMGGVETGRHALDLIAVGASAVALGTVLFADPGAPARVRRELAAEAGRRGFDDPSAARGVAHDPADGDTADGVGAPDNGARERSEPVRLKL